MHCKCKVSIPCKALICASSLNGGFFHFVFCCYHYRFSLRSLCWTNVGLVWFGFIFIYLFYDVCIQASLQKCFFQFWRAVENKQTNHFLVWRLKIKSNVIRIGLLLPCSVRMPGRSDVMFGTHGSCFSHVPTGCREGPASVVAQAGQGLVSPRV